MESSRPEFFLEVESVALAVEQVSEGCHLLGDARGRKAESCQPEGYGLRLEGFTETLR